MNHWKSASAGAIAAALAGTAPACADVTAKEVWTSWKNLALSYGQTVTGTEKMSGNTLTVSDVAVTMELPEGGQFKTEMGEIAFTERRDGTVAIEMSQEYPMTVRGTSDEGETVELAMTIRQTGLSMVASGDANETAYDFVAPEMAVALDSMVVEGEPIDLGMDISMARITGKYTLTQSDLRGIATAFNADSVRFGVSGTDPDDGATFAIDGEMRDVVSASRSTVPDGMDTTDLGTMLAAGFGSEGTLTHGGLAYVMDVDDSGDKMNVAVEAQKGALGFALSDGAMDYTVESTGLNVVLKGSQIPFPQIDIAMADSAFRLQMPLVKTDEPTDFAVLTRVAGLSVSDQIWAMFDPAGQLPRDPATLILDMAGKARWLVEITDPAQADSTETPGELHALTVNDFQLSLAGADLTGEGDFTFDNTDTTTFDGMPKPTGGVSLRLEGGNALLDKLVGMGLIPEDQAMGVRMMLGMFARPGGGNDTLVSEITVTEDGQVLANGQRLR